jgi:hypothetical protein
MSFEESARSYRDLCREYVKGNISSSELAEWGNCVKRYIMDNIGKEKYNKVEGKLCVSMGKILAKEWRDSCNSVSDKGTVRWVCKCGEVLDIRKNYGVILCPRCGGIWDFDGMSSFYEEGNC